MRPIDWNNVEEATSEFEKVTPGGYIAIITAVTDEPAKEYLKMELDIIDGKFAGYFTELCNAKGFWGLTLYRSYKESALGFFKAFKNCVEACNRGYIFNNDETTLKGKVIGIVLGEEEYIANDGSEKTRLYIHSTKTVDEIKEGKFKVPELKKRKETGNVSGNAFGNAYGGFQPVDNMPTPF